MPVLTTVGEGAQRLVSGCRLGPYQILDFIGAGGMGEVYRAHDTNLGRIVALKLLPAELVGDRERLRRFEEEARAASALSHPSIVTVYDAGQIGSRAFISMELVSGETVRDLLRGGPLSLRRSLRIATQIADGLAHAHDGGLVHRDLKPENIKVSLDGFAKILDFGLAKRVGPSPSESLPGDTRTAVQTSQGTVLGSIGYMSPEQASGARVGYASDQFSFGSVLYEMLTGRRAFDQPTPAETLSAIIRGEAVPLAQLNPAVPSPVRWIVERCLAKEPAERYALTSDLARDLASVKDHLGELLGRRLRTTTSSADDRSVVVLPATTLSAVAQTALADTMTDALITELTQCRGLRVLSRLSSMAYRERHSASPDIADELGVAWVVLSTVATSGRHLRVTAQLVDASSDENRWAGSYTRQGRDVLAAASGIARQIAREIDAVIEAAAPLGGAAASRVEKTRT